MYPLQVFVFKEKGETDTEHMLLLSFRGRLWHHLVGDLLFYSLDHNYYADEDGSFGVPDNPETETEVHTHAITEEGLAGMCEVSRRSRAL
jgi:hypothetical protein